MKLLVFPKNYTITIRDSKDELVGSAIITEQSPQTFLYSTKITPDSFNSMSFVFNFKDKSITVDGENTYKENSVIELGPDSAFGKFVFVDTKEIEPLKALMYR